ncbi:CGNR zinc finger domain-containing protein [Gimibacter soli]|uniref:CGNR zinc finger domain-containing protein n=1 Tax=Gimibacter soli TaxID=3024400 RepID=A0AAE9XNY4_9PROT|nr:CGNR zinc finger domain-containing protein [Gimibacter soli]WCL54533.1 CGNR zinc finger domain-containing protein [Gimibacter soli]
MIALNATAGVSGFTLLERKNAMTDTMPRIEAHEFTIADFIGGHPALDFANTITSWDQAPRDWIDTYSRLVDWAVMGGLVDTNRAAALRKAAANDRQQAEKALARAKDLRLALHSLFSALAENREPENDILLKVEAFWRRALASHTITCIDGRLVVVSASRAADLDEISDRLARHAVDLAGTFPAGRLRQCAGDRCGWLFVDHSKAGRRRWCDMATCGNNAKARRHQARQRSAS